MGSKRAEALCFGIPHGLGGLLKTAKILPLWDRGDPYFVPAHLGPKLAACVDQMGTATGLFASVWAIFEGWGYGWIRALGITF